MEREYWQSVDQKKPASGGAEFPEGHFDLLSGSKTRRDFLSILGFSVATVPLLTACNRIPVQKAVTYLKKYPEIVPGIANWYATTCSGCTAKCGMLIKTREGRPIKAEGNPDCPSLGGLCAVGQASVLSLYDSSRHSGPQVNGKPASWEEVDRSILESLRSSNAGGKKVVVLAKPTFSPSTKRVLQLFQSKNGNVELIGFEPFSRSSALAALGKTHGRATLPSYRLDSAELVVGIEVDFLGSWIDPVGLSKQYSKARSLNGTHFLRHVQLESRMSLTGSNADERIPLSPQALRRVLSGIAQNIASRAGKTVQPVQISASESGIVNRISNELWEKRGKSALLCDLNQLDAQVIVNQINQLLGNFGKTVLVPKRTPLPAVRDSLDELILEMEQGKVGALLFLDTNPVYNYRAGERFRTAMAKVPLRVSLSGERTETAVHCTHVCPGNHFLESWNDFELASGSYAIAQPTIQPLRATRTAQESLLVWSGVNSSYYQFIQDTWRAQIYSKSKGLSAFREFWDKSLHDGLSPVASTPDSGSYVGGAITLPKASNDDGLQLLVYEKISLRDGSFANNPWLQEMPDPVTKVTWDNYAQIGVATAKKLELEEGMVVEIQSGDTKISLPVQVQPGGAENLVAVAVGYGREVCGPAGDGVGANVFPLLSLSEGYLVREGLPVTLRATGQRYSLASTQTHHSMEGRDIVRETSLAAYRKDPGAGNKKRMPQESMWNGLPKGEHAWGVAVDLNRCTGCSGCLVSCQAENNVPVVGREEVKNRREMHWIRLDRYYSGAEDTPEVVHQPIFCAHCDHAPCETVCPVLATVQSSDGLNQQVYNRCVGTRYCANNCPYKVRRFNWFNYPHEDPMERMVLNPDVVVRTRGVMEKCSLCIQRIQEGKLRAKKEKRPLKDSDIKLACQQSCPSDAIVFGDLNDPESPISKAVKSPRNYVLLEELNVRPRVSFMTKVRDKG
ncbi:MAG: 4Fe-4S dicluster domain-containing protein [Bdellovibrionales bacterium]|nr:4Fe-4S dicluster domain-containing protein [Bdellovibrionales bacterium]